MAWQPTVNNCDSYLSERTGRYEWRAVRYRKAARALLSMGLDNTMTVMDVGAGMTEFDYCLRAEFNWRGRYIPIDGGIDSTDLNLWSPPRHVDFIVGLEIIEHLYDPFRAVTSWQQKAHGVVVSTPNPETTDVLAMDETHVVEVHRYMLEHYGFTVTEETFYGGVWSDGRPDSLFGVWERGESD